MGKTAIFTDVSLNAKSKIGFGACLIISEVKLRLEQYDSISREIRLKKFMTDSSTKLELESVLWALEEAGNDYRATELLGKLTIYTDSQCIAGLVARRERLERTAFRSGKQQELNNAILYRKFYGFCDKYKFKLIKVKGHSKKAEKDRVATVFAYVDKAARKALKNQRALLPVL